jgi:predicted HicB family RNase H-like nuclease
MGYKRIIDGKSYNTDTAALVHEWRNDPTEMQYEGLYQTKHGAFFLSWYDDFHEAGGIKPMSDDEAQKWLEKRDASAAVIEQYFGTFPEAGAAESRITLRLPGNLFNRVSASATAAKLSMNTYIMRVLERSESRTIG